MQELFHGIPLVPKVALIWRSEILLLRAMLRGRKKGHCKTFLYAYYTAGAGYKQVAWSQTVIQQYPRPTHFQNPKAYQLLTSFKKKQTFDHLSWTPLSDARLRESKWSIGLCLLVDLSQAQSPLPGFRRSRQGDATEGSGKRSFQRSGPKRSIQAGPQNCLGPGCQYSGIQGCGRERKGDISEIRA